jgi:hypothetical protein
MALQYNSESGIAVSPALLYLFRIALAIQNFVAAFFSSVKDVIGIVMGIASNL